MGHWTPRTGRGGAGHVLGPRRMAEWALVPAPNRLLTARGPRGRLFLSRAWQRAKRGSAWIWSQPEVGVHPPPLAPLEVLWGFGKTMGAGPSARPGILQVACTGRPWTLTAQQLL